VLTSAATDVWGITKQNDKTTAIWKCAEISALEGS